MANVTRYGILTTMLFLSLFPVRLTLFPLAPYRITQILGIIILLWIVKVRRYYPKGINKFFKTYIALFIFALIVVVLNGTFDFSYVIIIANMLLILCSAFFILFLIKPHRRKFHFICDMILMCVFIQEIISVLMYIIPSFYATMVSYIQVADTYSEIMYKELISFRIIGIGNMGWAAGANYGFSLLLLTTIPFVNNSFIYKHRWFYFVFIVLTIVIGVLSARTFLFFIPLAIYLYCKNSGKKLVALAKLVRTLIIYSIPLAIVLFVLIFLLIRYVDISIIEGTMAYAFEMFYNYSESGNFTANSLEDNMNFYKVIPDNLFTWILGDGLYVKDGFYYKGVDAGYLRQLFFFGIIGILLYWMCVYRLYNITSKIYTDHVKRNLFSVMFISCLILNYKGFIDMTIFISLFYACGIFECCKTEERISQRE